MDAEEITFLDALPTHNYLALIITRMLCHYFIYYSHQMLCTATGETERPRPSFSSSTTTTTTQDRKLSWFGKTQKELKTLEGSLK